MRRGPLVLTVKSEGVVLVRVRVLVGMGILVGALLLGSPVAATPNVSITSFGGTEVNRPQGIAGGPDGALWFANSEGNSIGRITPGGVVSIFKDASIRYPFEITAGPDGALWFTNNRGDSIGRITTGGVVTSYSDPSIHWPEGITAGPDGALWFTNNAPAGSIGRITTSGEVTNFTDTRINYPMGITAGPDGALWFTNSGNYSIGRITTGGAVSIYTADPGASPCGITAGPDGALWFTSVGNTSANSIGRITIGGEVSRFTDISLSVGYPHAITKGPDGTLWFTDNYTIFRITTDGAISYFDIGGSRASGITLGPDGALWFTDRHMNTIGRVVVSTAPSPPSTRGGGDGGGGVSADLYLTGSVEPASAPVGGTITWRLRVLDDKNKGPATGVVVDVVLPAGVLVVSAQTDRGSGCVSSGPGTLRCNLDWLSGDVPVGNITIVSNVTQAGELVLSATVTHSGTDPNPADNTVTIKANTPVVTPPTPPVLTPPVVKPLLGKPQTQPRLAVAGKRFTFTLAVKRSDTGAPLTGARMACSPAVAGKLLKHAESFKAGKARLTFVVPKTAKGKLLKITIKITTRAAKSTTKIYAFKVN